MFEVSNELKPELTILPPLTPSSSKTRPEVKLSKPGSLKNVIEFEFKKL